MTDFIGVYPHAIVPGLWEARIQTREGHYIYTSGRYHSPEEAVRAYDRLALSHYGGLAVFNFPAEIIAQLLTNPSPS